MIKIQTFTFNPVQENTYVLYNESGKAIIIDPGCYHNAERETLKNFLIQHNLTPVRLLNTHCHLDHVFGNQWVHAHYGLDLWIHPLEELVLQYAPVAGEKWGLPVEPYTGSLNFIQEGDRIELGDEFLQSILCPGHSPGSLCYYHESQKWLIGGDVLFYEGIGRTDLPGGDHDTLLNSIRQKLFVLPDEVIVYPGHGPATNIGHERKHNPFLQ